MGLFDSIKQKIADKREKRNEAFYAAELEKEELEKEKYLNMSCQEANSLFKDGCRNGYYHDDSNFSMGMWLKYSYDAPKGLTAQKSGLTAQKSEAWRLGFFFTMSLQYKFIIESCLRYSVNKVNNPYLNINYDGILIDTTSVIARDIWKLIDDDIIHPFDEDNWLFDKSFYEEVFYKNNYYPSDRTCSELVDKYKATFPKVKDMPQKVIFVKILIMLLLYQNDFKKKLGIPTNTDPCEVFKRDGKFVELTEMLNILDGLQTVLKFDKPSKAILECINSKYSSFDFYKTLDSVLFHYDIYEKLTAEERAALREEESRRIAKREASEKERIEKVDAQHRANAICHSCAYRAAGCRKIGSKEAIGCVSYKPGR